jgi:rubrerythrin
MFEDIIKKTKEEKKEKEKQQEKNPQWPALSKPEMNKMFEDVLKGLKKYKKSVKDYTCIGCDRILRKGEKCPICYPQEKQNDKTDN